MSDKNIKLPILSEFGDFTGSSRNHTDGAAIDFAEKYFPGWREVFNYGLGGIKIQLPNKYIYYMFRIVILSR